MNINGINSMGMPTGMSGMGAGGEQTDAVSRDLKNQIESLQKQMKELSSNQEMPMETKMKKRQELQKQISELEVQLRQHQMEVKREAAAKKKEERGSMDDMLGTKQQAKKSDGGSTGMSAGSMSALISADVSMKQAAVHGDVAKRMENRAGVLEAEIKLDAGRNGDTAMKEEELAKTKETADQAAASQVSTLVQTSEMLQDAAEESQKSGQTDDDKEKEKEIGSAHKEQEEENVQADRNDTFDVEIPGVAFSRGFNPVDVKV